MAGRLVLGPGGEVFEADSTDHVEEVGLHGQLAGIRQALAAGRKPAAGALLGLPELDGDVWVDIAGAAAVSGAAPKTITGWLSRGRPEALPVPRRAPGPVPAVLARPSQIEGVGQRPAGAPARLPPRPEPGARLASSPNCKTLGGTWGHKQGTGGPAPGGLGARPPISSRACRLACAR